MIRYSCHSENFGILSPDQTFSLIHALGFDCIDVACRSMIPKHEIIENPEKAARQIKSLSDRYCLPVSELFLSDVELDGQSVSPTSQWADTPAFDNAFHQICKFAQQAGFLSIMGSAGMVLESIGLEESFIRTAKTLQKQVDIASSYGLAFHVEPYCKGLLNTVDLALRMVETVPGLKYTLDFLHFQIQGISQTESMKLIPYAGHMHARQAKTGVGKCDFKDGQIDYAVIVQELKRINWSGDIAMEFWCDPELAKQGIQAVEQNLVMRYNLKTLFSA